MSTINLPRALSRFRFSLAGLLMFTLGVSAGLAWWRLPGATFAQFLLGCFTAWFVIGMVQRSRDAWKLSRDVEEQDPAFRTGRAFAVGVPICLALLLILTVLIDAALRVDWFGLDQDRDAYERFGSWIMRKLNDTLMCLAIVCGYWRRVAEPRERMPRRKWRSAALTAVMVVAGGVLLGLMLFSTAAVFNMVYTALDQYVFDFQPTRWAGHDFAPAHFKPLKLQRAFIGGGMLSMFCLVGAGAAATALATWWQKGRVVRGVLVSSAILWLAAAASLVWWCAFRALPALSPILASTIWEQPLADLLLAVVLIVSFAAVAALFVASVPARVSIDPQTRTPTHLLGLTLSLGIAGLVWDAVVTWWNRDHYWLWYAWADMRYNHIQPEELIRVAALMVLVGALRRTWRGVTDSSRTVWSIDPLKLATVWALFVAALVLVPPVGAWFGLSMLLQAGLH